MKRKDIGEPTKLRYCKDKPCYDKKAAISVINKRWKDDHVKLRAYQCHDHWHITHKELWNANINL